MSDEPVGLTDETFDLMDWIESGTVGRRQVTIYNDVEAGKRLQDVHARLGELGATEGPEDGPLEDAGSPEVAALLAEADELLGRLEASKAVWTVRAVSTDDVEATFSADGGVPEPKKPVPPPAAAGKKAAEDFVDRVNEWNKAVEAADARRRLFLIARAVVEVETPRGTVAGASVEALEALSHRPHGRQWIDRLYAAVDAATDADVEVPRPTSPERSTTHQV